MHKRVDAIISENLTALMAESEDYSTQAAIAKKCGVSQTTVGRILRMEVSATVENLDSIAGVFRLRAMDLLDPGLRERAKGALPGRVIGAPTEASPPTNLPVKQTESEVGVPPDGLAIIRMCKELPADDLLLIKGYVEGKFRERFPGKKAPHTGLSPGAKTSGRRPGSTQTGST